MEILKVAQARQKGGRIGRLRRVRLQMQTVLRWVLGGPGPPVMMLGVVPLSYSIVPLGLHSVTARMSYRSSSAGGVHCPVMEAVFA